LEGNYKMEVRLKYAQLAPEGIAKLREMEHYLNTGTGLEHTLLELMRLRASQLNGCDFCIGFHTAELKKSNETEERIGAVAEWRGSNVYTERERAALAWTEALTNIQDGHAPDAVYEQVRAHFSDVETVNLSLAVAMINSWNRLSIALGRHSAGVVVASS
jgi:AhpD family alkylhydroperoxidase